VIIYNIFWNFWSLIGIQDYDRYYASLAASAAASTNGTPLGLGIPGGDDFGASDDEEDRKPSIEYLQSLNDYRKRSRSREDIGTPKTKVARLTDNRDFGGGKANGHVAIPITVEPQGPGIADEGAPLDDPVVYGKFSFSSCLICRHFYFH
jgi:transcription initiation factor TFIIE subunit alpha